MLTRDEVSAKVASKNIELENLEIESKSQSHKTRDHLDYPLGFILRILSQTFIN